MADRNLVLQLLITAKDQASSVFSGLYSFLDRTTSATANLIRNAFANVFGGSLDGAIEFEAALSRVQSKSNATAAEMGKLKQAALDSGTSATDAAKALELLTGAGLSVDQAITALTPTLRVMQTEQVSADVAARALTDSLSVMGLNLEDTARAGDKLQASADATSTSVTALAEAIRTGGSGAVAAGLSFEQTVTILTAFAKAGLQGSEAGTALKAILADLGKASSPARAELAKLGVTSGDVGQAVDALGKAGARGQPAIKAFSQEAGPGLNALLQVGTKGLAAYQQQIDSATGGLKTAADTIQGNTLGALASLGVAWENLKLALTGPLLEPIAAGAKALAEQFAALASSGVLQKVGAAIASAFTDAGKAVVDWVKAVDWEAFSNRATTAVNTVKTTVTSMMAEVQGTVQTIADWTTTVFSPVTVAIDGYRAAWYTARGETEKAAAVQERLEQTAAAIGRALSGTSGELGKNAQAAKDNAAEQQRLADAVARTKAALETANDEFRTAQARGEDLAATLANQKQRAHEYRDALDAQRTAQAASTSAAQAAKPALDALGPATAQAATGAQALAEATPAAAQGIAQIQRATEGALPAQKEYRDGANFVTRAVGEQTAAAQQAIPPQERLASALQAYAASAGQGKDKIAQLTEEIARVSQASDGWRSGLDLNVITLNSLRDTADLTAQKLALLEERQRNGEKLDREVAAAKQAANQAQERYNQALDANIIQQERAVAAMQRANQLSQGEYDLYVRRAESALELARIKGDANEISSAENDLLDARVAKANDAVVGQQKEIEAYTGLIEATRRKLAADGELDNADQAQLATMADKLKAMEQERTALAQTAQAIQDKAAAEKEAAAAAKKAEEEKAKAAKEAADNAERETRRLAGATSAASEAFKQLSDAGQEAWRTFQNFELKGMGSGAIASLIRGFNDVLEAELRAAAGIDELVQAADGIGPSADYARDRLRDMAINGTSGIQGLTQAGEAARQKLEDIRLAALDAEQALAEMAGDFNRQILQLQGNQRAILELDHQENLRRLEEYYKTAGQLGSEEFATAKARAEELYRLKLAQLAAESQTGDSAAAGARTAQAWGEAADNAERFGKAMNTVGSVDLSRLQNQFALISNSATLLRDAL